MDLPLTPIIQAASLAFSFANNSRNVFKMIKEIKEESNSSSSSEILELTSLVYCLREPFYLCCQLQIRQETIKYVDGAVTYTRQILQACQVFLDEKEKSAAAESEDSSDEAGLSWQRFLTKEKLKVLLKLCSGVKASINVLNLALATVNIKLGRYDPATEISQTKDSISKATNLKFLLDTGRRNKIMLATGEVYGYVETAVKRKPGQRAKDFVSKGYANVYAFPSDGKKYQLSLKLRLAEGFDGNEKAAESEISFELPRKTFELKRQRKGDLDDEILGDSEEEEHELCYELRQDDRSHFLVFESPGDISAQAFEHFISLLQTDDSLDGKNMEKLSNLLGDVALETPKKRANLFQHAQRLLSSLHLENMKTNENEFSIV